MIAEELKDKVILIGKHPQQKNIMVVVSGIGKFGTIGNPGCVPNTVSRCMPELNVAHAKITVDHSGNMIVTNIKDLNATFVNGMQIMSKKITPDTIIELGADRYRVSVSDVLATANKIVGAKPPVKEYDIACLEREWNKYNNAKHEIQKNIRKRGQVRNAFGVIAACGIPGAFFLHPAFAGLTVFGALGALYSFITSNRDDSAEKLENLNEEFQDKYVCPNPECRRFLGFNNYKFIKNQYKMTCPFCKCKYVEHKK